MAEQRDYVMARLAAARGILSTASEVLDSCITQFVFPDDDKKGKDRIEALDTLSDAAGELSRSIELAQAGMEALEGAELTEEEPDTDQEEADDGGGD
jgi:hypothetical protein